MGILSELTSGQRIWFVSHHSPVTEAGETPLMGVVEKVDEGLGKILVSLDLYPNEGEHISVDQIVAVYK